MASLCFWAAGIFALMIAFAHVVVGGRKFVRPFLAHDIPDEQKWLAYYAWHASSVAFLFVAAGFFGAAILPERTDYAIVSTLFAASLVLTGLLVCRRGGLSPKNFEAIPMFSIVALMGMLGLAI
jgi:hypothetical protein